MGNKQHHLAMIQGIINRLASNSAGLKHWMVLVFVGTMFFVSREPRLARDLGWAFVIPVMAFWFVDAVYLRNERDFRKLYRKVEKQPEHEIDFSMTRPTKGSILKGMFSVTVCPIYGAVLVSLVLLFIW
ncbi:MAG: hypothetical protein OXN92_02455 [Gammaproteobacteria bacterium]|nr:hypothetical protein [Gammaproteobacteria bacterium]